MLISLLFTNKIKTNFIVLKHIYKLLQGTYIIFLLFCIVFIKNIKL